MGTLPAGSKMVGAKIGIPAWTSMSPLSNSWTTVGGWVLPQYRIWQLINEVEIIGEIHAGTITDGTTIFTMAAGAIPASQQWVCPISIDGGTGSAQLLTPRMLVTTGGALQVYGLPAGTTEIGFHGWFSLDS